MTAALFINYITKDPVYYVSVVVAVVVSISLHELGHGIAATWQGDDTPRVTGHMTLDPTVHLPPFSWFLLLFAGISYGLMPVNPSRFRSRYGSALVAACVEEGRRLGMQRLFALSYRPGFFERLGWEQADVMDLPRKVWNECYRCPKFPGCEEIAMVLDLDRGGSARPEGLPLLPAQPAGGEA